MNNLDNSTIQIKKQERVKANVFALTLTFIYTPLLIYNFILINRSYSDRIVELGNFKYVSGILLRIFIICIIVALIQKVINIKFKVRDIFQFKQAILLNIILFIVIFLITINFFGIIISKNSFYIASYLGAASLILYVTLTEYSTQKMGIYNEKLEEFVKYSTERKFTFKQDLRDSLLVDSSKPLEIFADIVKDQSECLLFKHDVKNIGKYFTYFVQSYTKQDVVYVIICFSKTGKEINSVLTYQGEYTIDDFEKNLAMLNNQINTYLQK